MRAPVADIEADWRDGGDNLFIRRMERTNSTAGWEVRVDRLDLQVSHLLSDSVFGGSRRALAAARAWRDQQPWATAERKASKRAPTQKRRGPAMPKLGRYVSEVATAGRARECAFWFVTWKDGDGYELTRKFSVTRLGEDGAKQKAEALYVECKKNSKKLGIA